MGKSTNKLYFCVHLRNVGYIVPEVTNYLKRVSEKGFNRLEVRTEAGRLFTFDKPSNETEEKYNAEKGNLKRECKNLFIKGLCADMLKISMGNLFIILEPSYIHPLIYLIFR